MKIYLADLLKIADKIIEYLHSNTKKSIFIPQDYYWNITDRFNTSTLINLNNIGSLLNDKERFESILQKNRALSQLDLEHLGQLFIAIGDSLDSIFNKKNMAQDNFFVEYEVTQIKLICDKLFDSLKKSVGECIELNVNYYYMIPARYDMYNNQQKLMVGYINTDIKLLNNFLHTNGKFFWPNIIEKYGQFLVSIALFMKQERILII